MKKFVLVLLLLCMSLFGFTYDPVDGPGSSYEEILAGWRIYDDTPEGATITPYFRRGSYSYYSGVTLNGDGLKNGFVLENPNGSNWNEYEHNTISWWFNYRYTAENVKTVYSSIFYVTVKLTDGTTRYLAYSRYPRKNYRRVLEFKLSLPPIIPSSTHTVEQRATRYLTKDLHRYEPDKEIDYIVDFAVRGTGVRVYYVQSSYANNFNVVLFDKDSRKYYSTWRVYDNNPSGATVEVSNQGAVLSGEGIKNGFVLEDVSGNDWNLVEYNYVKFEGAFPQSDAIIYLTVKLDDGSTKYLSYVTDKAMADYGSYGNVLVSYLPKSEDGNISTVFDIQKTLHDNGITDYGRVLVDVAVRGSGTVTHISAHDSLETIE
jgi:hypothetical protein